MLWCLLNRRYFLPINTKYGLCSVRRSVAGDAGVQRDHQFSWRQSQRPVTWYCQLFALEWWHCWLEIWLWCWWKRDLSLASTLQQWRSFELPFLPPALLPFLSVRKKVFFNEKLSCKNLQRKQKWSAVPIREVHFLCSSIQRRACKTVLGLQLVLQQFTPMFSMQRAVILL